VEPLHLETIITGVDTHQKRPFWEITTLLELGGHLYNLATDLCSKSQVLPGTHCTVTLNYHVGRSLVDFNNFNKGDSIFHNFLPIGTTEKE
jgi:hypothetical protein